ncbi:flavin-containing monooxygenase [Dactylosporangium sp. CS-033363]|uniref:flavin-containing monooxygenase n=1 Tax=Dactylosporangium sp. CS-033363 TaxID=3239935 RepID=UPI003D910705
MSADGRFEDLTGNATHWRDGEPVYDRGDTVCVIGAGGTGLTTIKNLREAGFGVDCYERETGVGGGWNWRHDRSPVYASTHLISSKPFTQFPDFPMPDDWPDYPHHSQMLQYFERYADHFGLREHIWFGTEVARVEPAEDAAGGPPRWDVTVKGSRGGAPRTMRYAAVVAANGHNWAPKMPEYEGLTEYRGKVIHAGQYKDAAQLRGRKVLVIGAGNSGCDIAVEAAQQAAKCWHSTRRGYWYAPKFALGRPADQVNDKVLAMRLPTKVRQWLLHRTINMTVGDLTRFGLPKPEHGILEMHPLVNSQLPYYLGHGDVVAVPDIKHFESHDVVLADGRVIDPDLVVMATGYLPKFDFLAPELLSADAAGRPRLALQLLSRTHPTLAVAGLLQPDSALFTLSHWQAVFIAQWLRVLDAAPDRAQAVWARLRTEGDRRYTQAKVTESTRHWFEVSHFVYLKELEKTLHELEAVK